jgi:protein-tyrosine sulfotransferase
VAPPVRSGDVFIHGLLPRSGTNYLSRALQCHPDLRASPRSLWEFPHLRKSDPLMSYAASMARAPKLPDLEEGDVLRMIGDAWLRYASEGLPEGCRLVIKEPTVEHLDRFFRFFPRACLLVLVRDGRDVACSAMKTRFASPAGFVWRHPRTYPRILRSPIGELARRWREASRNLRAFLQQCDERERVKVVRFEDLVRDGEAQMHGILEFLGLPRERFAWESLSDLDVRGSSFLGNRDGELHWERSDAPASFDPVGRWRRWDERELRRYLSVAAAELRHWGYLDVENSG